MLDKIIFKIIILSLVLMFSAAVFVQPALADHSEEETLPEAGLTPASPLHIFERFGDWVRLNVLTFNQARKAEIKVEIAEKRLSELKAIIESGEDEATVARAEGFVRARSEEMQRDLERFDNEGRDASSLIEKFNALSLKQQSVLENILERSPEQAKEALSRAIEHSRKGLGKAEEVLKKQIEKKLVKEEKAKEIFENMVGRLKEQVEHRSEKLEKIAEELGEIPPELKEQFEAKLKHLEDRLLNVESREELKDIRADLKENLKDAASTILDLRKRHQFRDEVSEEFLRDIEHDKFDVAKKAAEAIAEAEEEIAEVKTKIARAESSGKDIPQNVQELMSNAEKHLVKAKDALENKNFGEAFGQATAARHNAKSAKRFLEFILEGKDKARKAIEEAKEEIAEFEAEIEEVKAETGQVPAAALKMLEAAKAQLRQAESALAEGNLEQAFRHAESAERMADRGKDILDKEEDVFEKRREVEEKVLDKTLESERKLEKRGIEDAARVLERTKEEKTSVKVRITSSGFEPREVKVRKGGAVVWVNESGGAAWPASAVHPTHTLYPQKGGCIGSAFDACRRIENGGTYEFRFDHVGTWKYHDHLNPSLTGVVEVAGD